MLPNKNSSCYVSPEQLCLRFMGTQNAAYTQIRLLGSHKCDFLYILGGRRQQRLRLNLVSPPKSGIAIAIQFFRIGKTALNGLFSSLIHRFASVRQPLCIDPFFAVLPYMASNTFHMLGIAGTAFE